MQFIKRGRCWLSVICPSFFLVLLAAIALQAFPVYLSFIYAELWLFSPIDSLILILILTHFMTFHCRFICYILVPTTFADTWAPILHIAVLFFI